MLVLSADGRSLIEAEGLIVQAAGKHWIISAPFRGSMRLMATFTSEAAALEALREAARIPPGQVIDLERLGQVVAIA